MLGRTLGGGRVTFGLIAASLAAYFVLGSGPADIAPQTSVEVTVEAFLNVFRHGDGAHLFGNMLVIFWGGSHIEPRLGSKATFVLALGAILLGTVLQIQFVDANFLGLSGVAYCFALCTFMLDAGLFGMAFLIAAGMILVGTQLRFMSDNVAAFAHMGGLLFGGGWSVFNKIFGQKETRPADPNQPYLSPLQAEHIGRVVEIIDETDDDDAADANETLRERGCDGMYALWHQNRIIGVTGFSPSEARNDVAWLSWTYLERQARGRALGRFMLDELLLILNKNKIRKIFIATSDYKEDGEDVYADARKFYEAFGAKLEITIPGFYSPDEAKLIYGLVNPGMGAAENLDDLGNRGVIFTGVELDEDSDDVGAICWEEAEIGVLGLGTVLGLANSNQFRLCVAALPADISDAAADKLKQRGFEHLGMLEDYYAQDLGQSWWRFSLT